MDCEICFRFDVGDVRGVSSQHVLEVLHDVYISQAILLVVVSKGIYMVPHRRLLTVTDLKGYTANFLVGLKTSCETGLSVSVLVMSVSVLVMSAVKMCQ